MQAPAALAPGTLRLPQRRRRQSSRPPLFEHPACARPCVAAARCSPGALASEPSSPIELLIRRACRLDSLHSSHYSQEPYLSCGHGASYPAPLAPLHSGAAPTQTSKRPARPAHGARALDPPFYSSALARYWTGARLSD
jgi:hypothetical protein